MSIDAWIEEKPYREVYDNRIYEKTGWTRTHNLVMDRFAFILNNCCALRGDVCTSLRVYLMRGVSLCPDVAFVSDKRLEPLSEAERETPPFAPDIVVEVLAPEDKPKRIRRKATLHLLRGATLVLIADPVERTVLAHTRRAERLLSTGDVIEHEAFPELHIPVADVFAPLDRRR